MKRLFLNLLFIFCFVLSTNGQIKEKYLSCEDSIKKYLSYNEFKYVRNCDSLFIGNNNYFFCKTPLSCFRGWSLMFSDEECPPLYMTSAWGAFTMRHCIRYYNVSWEIKDSELYLKRINNHVKNDYWESEDPETRNDVSEWKYVTDKEFNQRFESLTERKFDSQGRIKADWMTGEYILTNLERDSPFRKKDFDNRGSRLFIPDSLYEYICQNQRYYKVYFNQGKLQKMEPLHYKYKDENVSDSEKEILTQTKNYYFGHCSGRYRSELSKRLYSEWKRLGKADREGYTIEDANKICWLK